MIAPEIERALWPPERLADAIATLARAAGLLLCESALGEPLPPPEPDALARGIDAVARSLGLGVTAIAATADAVDARLRGEAPMMVAVDTGKSGKAVHFLAVLRVARAKAVVLMPDGSHARISLGAVVDAVRGPLGRAMAAGVGRVLDRASVPTARRKRARRALLDQVLAGRVVDVGFRLGLPPSAPFVAQMRAAGVFTSMGVMIAAQLAYQLLALTGWWLVGRGALDGQIERGWLMAWGLVLLTAIAPWSIASFAQAIASLRVSILLKRRLMNGALHLGPEEVRHQGSGELLARVIESEAVEALGTTGGIAALLSVLDIVIAATVLALTPGGGLASCAFLALIVVAIVAARRLGGRLADWTEVRLALTQDLVERMLGHRTRLAQEPRKRWHSDEDPRLEVYTDRSTRLDAAMTTMQGALPRAWLVLGMLAIAPGFVRGTTTGSALAVSVGSLLLGYRAITGIGTGMASLLRARIAWTNVRPLFEAGAREEHAGALAWLGAVPSGAPLLEARDVCFRYADRREPVLRGVNIAIGRRDRVLVEGPSGGGKSTLGSVLTGLRTPSSGLLLLGGLDLQTLGASSFRRYVAAAPQFHENYIFNASLAFNLLMGRAWPARTSDLAEAEAVCRDLGLGPLLDRMPSGLMQMVGETGWQLSHGERSRIFIARALLQRAEVIVLDESLASLDPESLRAVVQCVVRRAPALVVIAHP